MMRGLAAITGTVAALLTSAACTVNQADAPPLSPAGPTDFAQSMTVTAIPDRLTQDGSSQSAISVRVAGPNGQPASGVPIRVDMLVDGTLVDFGTLSARSIVTGSDGRANTVYTAPPAPPATAGGVTSTVTIRAVAVGGNAQTATPYTADIRLVPAGVILPPAGTPTASFATSPTTLLAGLPANFDASGSQPGSGASSIVSYSWSFGDATSGSGRTTTHTYSSPNSYNVTLTVTNDRGVSASTSQTVQITTGVQPVPVFNFSPSAPGIGESVFFNASASQVGAGRRITAYNWTFGDGGTGGGVSPSHVYTTAGTYTITLTLTDDLGQTGTTTLTLTVGSPPAPTAAFTSTVNISTRTVVFVASTSQTAQGQTITDFFWNFGDDSNCPPVGSGVPSTCYVHTTSPTITHTYLGTGSFVVNLVVRDSAGRTGSTSNSITVTDGTPVPAIVVSPTTPVHGLAASFDGTGSTPFAGTPIVSYTWTFGDGTPSQNGSTTTHVYATAGVYVVRLTVTDSLGRTGTVTANVTVQ